MRHIGHLTITENNAQDYVELMEVTGYLHVWAECSLPALKSVGYLDVQAECSLPALTSVACSLHVWAKVKTPYGKFLCLSGYGLFRTAAGTYHAGCRQGLTAEQALAHWGGRTDERARMFTAAINAAEAANQKG